jgi:hypothetical protein
MYKGVVSFEADVRRGVGIRFPQVVFRCPVSGVEKVEIEAIFDEANHSSTIKNSVYLESTPTQDDGVATALDVTGEALNRLAFNHKLSIGTARVTAQTFEPIVQQGGPRGVVLMAGACEVNISLGVMSPLLGVSGEVVKDSLEAVSPPGESYYGLFRSACQTESRAEEFLQLYRILLTLRTDDQGSVDEWLKGQDPQVALTPSGDKRKKGKMETIYTRLRNEFSHSRSGVDLDNTKKEMSDHLERLKELARVAIRTLA